LALAIALSKSLIVVAIFMELCCGSGLMIREGKLVLAWNHDLAGNVGHMTRVAFLFQGGVV